MDAGGNKMSQINYKNLLITFSNKILGVEIKVDGTGIIMCGLIAMLLVIGVIGIFVFWNMRLRKEISLRYEIERQLINAKKEAEHANQAKSMFLANISHEIRTPMNAIIGLGELLQQTELSVKQRDYLTKINTASNHLLGIINDILDFSKIESGKILKEVEAFSLKKIICNLSDILELTANEKGLELVITQDKNIPDRLLGDSLRLNQILINLINNAIKFTEKGKVMLDVRLIEETDSQVKIQFEIKDTGIGMSDEQLSTLFEAFSQADATMTRKYGGTGLGLSIVKNYTTMLEGELKMESQLNIGTTFMITIPFEVDLSIPAECTDVSITSGYSRKNILEGINILVVEDNLINQQIAEENLTLQGASITIANNGVEALEKIEHNNHYNLVIMDLQMPVMDGIKATEEIRKQYDAEALPIIALTADVQKSTQLKIKEVGMQAYVSKPINLSDLYRVVIRVLNIECLIDSRNTTIQEEKTLISEESLALNYALKTFDVVTGLKRMNDNTDLYLKIIRQFADSYNNFRERVVSDALTYTQEDLVREFHTLKGLSASLGNEAISEKAKIIEHKLKLNKITISDFFKDSAFDVLTDLLQKSIEEINNYIAILDVHVAPSLRDEIFSDDFFDEALKTLKIMLDSYDIEAQEKLKLIRGNFLSNGWSEQYEKLKIATESYDYKLAQEIIEGLNK